MSQLGIWDVVCSRRSIATERKSRVQFSQGEYVTTIFILLPGRVQGILLLGFQLQTASQRSRGTTRDSCKSLYHGVGKCQTICDLSSLRTDGGLGENLPAILQSRLQTLDFGIWSFSIERNEENDWWRACALACLEAILLKSVGCRH